MIGVLLALAVLALPPCAAATRAGINVQPHSRRWTLAREKPDDLLAIARTVNLIAVCLRTGISVPSALAAVVDYAPPRLSRYLHRAGDLLALGAAPPQAWHLDENAFELRELSTAIVRAAQSGVELADCLSEVASVLRAGAQDTAIAKAARAGVLIGGPLGLCFLPAFLCVGIVPVVIGLAHSVLSDGVL